MLCRPLLAGTCSKCVHWLTRWFGWSDELVAVELAARAQLLDQEMISSPANPSGQDFDADFASHLFELIHLAGAKGMAHHIFTEDDLKKHSENGFMQRLLAVALLEMNLQECGINYAKELDPHSVFANRKFPVSQVLSEFASDNSWFRANRMYGLLQMSNFSGKSAVALCYLCGAEWYVFAANSAAHGVS